MQKLSSKTKLILYMEKRYNELINGFASNDLQKLAEN